MYFFQAALALPAVLKLNGPPIGSFGDTPGAGTNELKPSKLSRPMKRRSVVFHQAAPSLVEKPRGGRNSPSIDPESSTTKIRLGLARPAVAIGVSARSVGTATATWASCDQISVVARMAEAVRRGREWAGREWSCVMRFSTEVFATRSGVGCGAVAGPVDVIGRRWPARSRACFWDPRRGRWRGRSCSGSGCARRRRRAASCCRVPARLRNSPRSARPGCRRR